MISIKIAIDPMSKPRGMIGASGNMTHSSDGTYRQWQTKFRKKMIDAYPQKFPKFFCLVYIFSVNPKKLCRKQDLDNMVGAINDVLTFNNRMKFKGWIQDDSWLHIPRFWTEAQASDSVTSTVQICVCRNPFDFLKLYITLHIYKEPLKITKILKFVRSLGVN